MMLQLLTLARYLPAMTATEQDSIFRDGKPFTLADIKRWQMVIEQRNECINDKFKRAWINQRSLTK